VAVRRHRFSSLTCGARGDFIYGTLDLMSTGAAATLASRLGKVELPDGFAPDLIALPPDGTAGVLTDLNSVDAVEFATTTPFAAATLAIPPTVTGDYIGAVGIAADSTRLALAVATPPQVVTFNRAAGTVVRTASETPATLRYQGNTIDFSMDDTVVYVPGTAAQFNDRVNLVRTDNSNLADVLRRLFTPGGFQPVQARLSPAGGQLAVLMADTAPDGEADLLSFVNLATGGFVTPALDLTATTGGTVLAHDLVYAADGSRVFLAGLGAVVAVETTAPYTTTEIDISLGAGDSPVALALSGDGAVLAVAVDDAVGSTDFAVIDANTLEVLNTQDLPGIGNRRALDIAHFATRRIAMVANFDSTVVAVQTESPYAVDEPVRVADVQGAGTLGRIVSGGDVIAVTNLDEPAVYLFAPAAAQ